MRAPEIEEIANLAAEAYVFGFPALEMQRVRHGFMYAPHARELTPANTFRHVRKLATANSRVVTTPNNDTLYSTAWLDLAAGPVQVSAPALGDRYYSFAFMDFFTNVFAIIGRRNAPGGGVTRQIVGPDWLGESGPAEIIRAPTNTVWLLARFVVDGADDLPAVHALQDRSFLGPTARPQEDSPVRRDWVVNAATEEDPARLFDALNGALAENPPLAADADIMARIGSIGIAPGRQFPKKTATEAEALRRGVDEARAGLKYDVRALRQAEKAGEWRRPPMELGDYGANYRLRAVTALAGLAALPPQEAMYLSTICDSAGAPLEGVNRYEVRFAKGETPPAHAFWSITLYEIDPQGRAWFARNPLDRYSIGDRTPGLRYGPDGSLTIQIAREWTDPSNVLPAPDGAFFLSLRVYEPAARLLHGGYMPPPVVRA
ncbi:MAG: DUF1254 domain-containing protein [Caulobacteraceae bacterium]